MMSTASFTLPAAPECARVVLHDDIGASPLVGVGVGNGVMIADANCGSCALFAARQQAASPVSAVGFDARAHLVASGHESGTFRVLNRETEDAVYTGAHRTRVTFVDFHPFGNFLATSSLDTHVRIWDLRKKSCLQVYKHRDASAAVGVVRIAMDGLHAVSGTDDGSIHVYDLRGGKAINTLRHHKAPITSIAFHPRVRSLASVDASGVVATWDLDHMDLVFAIAETACNGVALTDTTLFGAGAKGLKSWAMPLGKSKAAPTLPPIVGARHLDICSRDWRVVTVDASDKVLNVVSWNEAQAGGPGLLQPARVAVPSVARVPADAAPVAAGAITGPAPRSQGDLTPRRQAPVASASAGAPASRAQAPAVACSAPSASPTPAQAVEMAEVDDMMRRSETVTALVRRRSVHLSVMRGRLTKNVQDALDYATQLVADRDAPDSGAVVTFLDCFIKVEAIRDQVGLDHLAPLLKLIDRVLERHQQPDFVTVCLRLASTMLVRFQQRIHDALRGALLRAPGTDLAMEERERRCAVAKKLFVVIWGRAEAHATKDGTAGAAARDFIAAAAAGGF